MNHTLKMTAVMAAVLALAACSDGDVTTSSSATSSTSAGVSGSAFKGPLSGASICLYQIDNSASTKKGAQVIAATGSTPTIASGCIVTGNDGLYSIVLPANTSGDLIVEASGGTYCSDESLYNGSTCAGGGTPIALGTNKLRTVVTAPASGIIASAPLTLLTTAAASGTATLSASSFNNAYGTIATNFGITGSTPATSPTAASLNPTVAGLSSYLGDDTTILGDLVSGIASGAIKGVNGVPYTKDALACSAVDSSDQSRLNGWDMCSKLGDGTSRLVGYYFNNPLLSATNDGVYFAYSYTDGACSEGEQYLGNTPMTVQYTGTATLAVSASADPLVSQSGTVSKFAFTISPAPSIGINSTSTYSHLVCRTQAASDKCGSDFKAYMTSTSSPVKDGHLTRIDGKTLATGYCD